MNSIGKQGIELIDKAATEKEAYNAVFSKNGLINSQKEAIRSLPKEQWGSHFKELEQISKELLKALEDKFPKVDTPSIDTTIETFYQSGKLHPISQEINLVREIMASYGFEHIDGPIVDDEYNNFDALNVHKNHPARDMQDTFYLRSGRLLRTHTSNLDFRTLSALMSAKAELPIKFFHVGRVYRRDEDSTHSTMFFQLEGVYVDRSDQVDFGHLKWFIREFLENLFNQKNLKMRFRPSYFPFTSPSFEADIRCVKDGDSLTILKEGEEHKKAQWMEILGTGMLCKNILQNAGYEDHAAFAFGLGIDRIVMLKHGISNINDLYKNRLPFLRKYGLEGGVV